MSSVAPQNLCEENGNVAAQEHQRLIQRRVLDLQSEIRGLVDFHNTLSPINRLPAEILSSIFIQASFETRKESLSWIRLTHVCRHWRAVALECAALWSDLSFANLNFTEVMLSRSKNAPLAVEYDAPYPRTTLQNYEVLSNILRQGHRLRSLTIMNDRPRGLVLHLRKTLSRCIVAPILEELRLCSRDDNFLCPPFLSGGAPSLKYLRISGCKIADWSCIPLGPGLTTLDLDLTIAERGRLPSGKELLASLRNMPLLKKLRLAQVALPVDGYPPLPSDLRPPVVCANLQTLELVASPKAMCDFFRMVRLPLLRDINITFNNRHGYTTEVMDNFFSALHVIWSDVADEGFKELRMARDGRNRNSLWFDFHGRTGASSNEPHTLLLANVTRSNVKQILPILRRGWEVSKLQVLDVDMDNVVEDTDWILRFADLPKLQDVTVVDCGPVMQFAAAMKQLALAVAANPGISSFPALERITIEEAHLSSRLLRSLTEALQARSKHGDPALKVYITDCEDMNEKAFEAFMKELPDVEVVWDGRS
ncbi:hypothetical protein D9611_001246 [Ephemerocybe angulata]|uniref:F-box domain-containing protein n=1 Tax=Ephemerocybe angulata TaxID=980116 RepID=A0A8H5CK47_9AGAR|nr:hypothetical protein D9611_001246 [Tulosesus angulatus]